MYEIRNTNNLNYAAQTILWQFINASTTKVLQIIRTTL